MERCYYHRIILVCLMVCIVAILGDKEVMAAGFTESSSSVYAGTSVDIYADANTSIKEWKSSDEKIAKIKSNYTTKKCTVETIADGIVTITGTAEDGSVATYTLTVYLGVFDCDKKEITLGIKGKTKEDISVTYNGKEVYGKYTYKLGPMYFDGGDELAKAESLNPDICEVKIGTTGPTTDTYGDWSYVIAKGVGTTTIKLTSIYGQELSINVTVLPEYNGAAEQKKDDTKVEESEKLAPDEFIDAEGKKYKNLALYRIKNLKIINYNSKYATVSFEYNGDYSYIKNKCSGWCFCVHSSDGSIIDSSGLKDIKQSGNKFTGKVRNTFAGQTEVIIYGGHTYYSIAGGKYKQLSNVVRSAVTINAGVNIQSISYKNKKMKIKWKKLSNNPAFEIFGKATTKKYIIYASTKKNSGYKKVGTVSGTKDTFSFAKISGKGINIKKPVYLYIDTQSTSNSNNIIKVYEYKNNKLKFSHFVKGSSSYIYDYYYVNNKWNISGMRKLNKNIFN